MKPLGQGKREGEGGREGGKKTDGERQKETHRQRDREKVGSFSLRKKRLLDFHLCGDACVLKRLHMGV